METQAHACNMSSFSKGLQHVHDKSDQRIKLQRCRHHYKWPRRLMVKFFVWSAFNGYIIQNLCKPHIIQGKPIQTFRMFIDELCDDLVGSHRRALVPICQDARLQETKYSCITNQTLTRESGISKWKQQMCCVFREVQAVQKSESGGQRHRPAKPS